AIANILAIFMCLKMDVAMFIPNIGKNHTEQCLKAAMLASLAFGAAGLILCASYYFLYKDDAGFWLAFYTVTLSMCVAIFTVANAVSNKKSDYKTFSSARVIAAGASVALKIAFGYLMWGWRGFVAAIALSYIIALLYMWPAVRQEVMLAINQKQSNWAFLLSQKSFLVYNLPTSIINSAGQFAPIIVLGV